MIHFSTASITCSTDFYEGHKSSDLSYWLAIIPQVTMLDLGKVGTLIKVLMTTSMVERNTKHSLSQQKHIYTAS